MSDTEQLEDTLMTHATTPGSETRLAQAFAEFLSAHVSGSDTRAVCSDVADQFLEG